MKNSDNAQENNILVRSSLVPRVIIDSIVNKLSKDPDVLPTNESRLKLQNKNRHSFRVVVLLIINTLKHRQVLLRADKKIIKSHQKFKEQMSKYEQKCLKLAPEIEGRSIIIKDDIVILINLIFYLW
jgi:hypothetical protein